MLRYTAVLDGKSISGVLVSVDDDSAVQIELSDGTLVTFRAYSHDGRAGRLDVSAIRLSHARLVDE